MDCSPPGSSVHGILQERILEWVAILFSRGSSQPMDQTQVSCIQGRLFTIWATREALTNMLPALSSPGLLTCSFTFLWCHSHSFIRLISAHMLGISLVLTSSTNCILIFRPSLMASHLFPQHGWLSMFTPKSTLVSPTVSGMEATWRQKDLCSWLTSSTAIPVYRIWEERESLLFCHCHHARVFLP